MTRLTIKQTEALITYFKYIVESGYVLDATEIRGAVETIINNENVAGKPRI